MIRCIAVCGPTAVGKTKLAIEIAEAMKGEIVSCDSMQIYKHMDIGSAKPSAEELSRVSHHMIDVAEPQESFSAAKYKDMAMAEILDIDARGKLPIICGGTGLYLEALLYDLDFAAEPEAVSGLRDELYAIADDKGADALFEILKNEDPEAAERIHPNNVKRVVRAIESARLGVKLTDFAAKRNPNPELDVTLVGLCMEKEELYDRINRRVDDLMAMGLADEVAGLMKTGLTDSDISMKGIGYKELISYFNGEILLDDAVDLIKKNTRHYAKRQMTWLRRYRDMKWFNVDDYSDFDELKEDVLKWLRRK